MFSGLCSPGREGEGVESYIMTGWEEVPCIAVMKCQISRPNESPKMFSIQWMSWEHKKTCVKSISHLLSVVIPLYISGQGVLSKRVPTLPEKSFFLCTQRKLRTYYNIMQLSVSSLIRWTSVTVRHPIVITAITNLTWLIFWFVQKIKEKLKRIFFDLYYFIFHGEIEGSVKGWLQWRGSMAGPDRRAWPTLILNCDDSFQRPAFFQSIARPHQRIWLADHGLFQGCTHVHK